MIVVIQRKKVKTVRRTHRGIPAQEKKGEENRHKKSFCGKDNEGPRGKELGYPPKGNGEGRTGETAPQ